jgi:hypothetical protein
MNTLILKRPPAPPGELHVSVSLMEFLVLDTCPSEWLGLNLYLFRDDQVAFYIGQSERAFERAWQHIQDAYKGRSVIGRFLLVNWPVSLRFTLEFFSAAHERFAGVGQDLDAAEVQLIAQWRPCFNLTANKSPTSLPARYQPPSARPQHLRRLGTMKSEARAFLRAENKRKSLDDISYI